MDVIALGELLIDFTVAGPPQSSWRNIRGSAGGAPANVLAALSRLGGMGGFIGKVGLDAFGDYLEASLHDLGIDTTGLLRDKERTTLAFVTLGEGGERSFSFERHPGADTRLAPSDIREEWFKDTQVFHFGSLSLTREPSREATWEAVNKARNAGCVISFDPNLRPQLWGDLEEAKRLMLEGVKHSDIIKVADDEVLFLTAQSNLRDGIAELQKHHDSAVFLVTKGRAGSSLVLCDEVFEIPSLNVDSVDTTAAGDAFFGTFLYAITHRRDGDAIEHVLKDADRLKPMVRMANIAGALATTKAGAFSSLPTLAEVESFL